jgi:hypothetical protein
VSQRLKFRSCRILIFKYSVFGLSTKHLYLKKGNMRILYTGTRCPKINMPKKESEVTSLVVETINWI